MSRVILPFNPRPLAYPGRGAGFDPSHPIAGNIRFSGVARGNSFINLLNGHAGALNNGNTTAKIFGGLGPTMNSANPAGATNAGSYFSTSGLAVPASTTIACIFQVTITGQYHGLFDADPSGFAGWLFGIRNTYEIYDGTQGIGVLVPPSGVPLFVVISVIGTTATLVETNLSTGAIRSELITVVAPGGSESTYTVGDSGFGGGNAFNGGIAAAMYSSKGYKLPALRQWAQDPWAFWYP